MNRPRRPALKYWGGKWRIAPWIISHFPAHHCYVEPFAGAASVLLRKKPSRLEYLNDADKRIVTFFQVLRDRWPELRRLLELTPFSREEMKRCQEPHQDPLEEARRVYVWLWQGRGGHEATTGWRFQRAPSRNKTALRDFTVIDHLPAIVERLRKVAIECDDAMAVLRRYDATTTLFYVDPPYAAEVRSKTSRRYGVEFKSQHDHRLLAAVLNELDGMVVLSGIACELYEELYEEQGWTRDERESRTQAGSSIESVWLNRACVGAQRQMELEGVAL